MRVSKIKQKKSGFVDIEELNAYQMTYQESLSVKDYTFMIGSPAIILAVLSFALTYYWWVALIFALIGAFYGYQVILPATVKRQYEMNSLLERNRFVNNMTNKMTDKEKTIYNAMTEVQNRLYGELKSDIKKLNANLIGTNKEQIQNAFGSLAFKYREDVVFSQFLEQLETCVYEGNINVDSMKDIKKSHNIFKKKSEDFLKVKNGYQEEAKHMMMLVCFFLLAITVSFGFSTFFEVYARSIIGWITTVVYMIVVMVVLNKFVKDYFDESIMTVGVKK